MCIHNVAMLIAATTIRVRQEDKKRMHILRNKNMNEPDWSVINRALKALEDKKK